MKSFPSFVVSLSVAGLALTSCGQVDDLSVGKDNVDSGASPDATDGGTAGAGGGQTDGGTCELPTVGNALLRIGNLVPNSRKYDYCLTPTGTGWDSVKPVLAGSGSACPVGLGYKEISASFGVQEGSYDVKVVEGPAAGCAGPAVAMLNSLPIAEGKATSLLLFGDGSSAPVLKAMGESRATTTNASALRFVHAQAGQGLVDVGPIDSVKLPANLVFNQFKNVAFSGLAPAGGEIDANGYAQINAGGGSVPYGTSISGQSKAFLATTQALENGGSSTLYAVGRVGDINFPMELWSCNELESTGIYEDCGGAMAVDLVVDTVNTQLSGAFTSFGKERRQPIIDAISNLESNVACVVETWDTKDRKAIAEAASKKFPYVVNNSFGLDAALNDAKDQSGKIPAEPATAACSGTIPSSSGGTTSVASLLDALLDCAKTNCAVPATEDGKIDGNCLQKCSASVITLASKAQACWSCAFLEVAGGETVGHARDQCKNNPKARFAFRGDSGAMLLSSFPFREDANNKPEEWLIGSTEWRIGIIRAPITLPNGTDVDVYCTQLATPVDSMTRPYTGLYGDGKTGVQGWEAELILQSQKLIDFVKLRSEATHTKAIIAGSFYSGGKYTGITEAVPVAFQKLQSYLPLAVPVGFVPACTSCSSNPIWTPPGKEPSGIDYWLTYNMLSNIPVTSVREAKVIWSEPVIDVNPANAGAYKIPLSTQYGFRSVIRLTP